MSRMAGDSPDKSAPLADVPVSVVRDTIRAASCGREGKFVAYLPVCRALEAAAIAARAARAAAAESAAVRAAKLREERAAAERAAAELSETEAVADAAKRLAAAAIAKLRDCGDAQGGDASLRAALSMRNRLGKTALDTAAGRGAADVVRVLLDSGRGDDDEKKGVSASRHAKRAARAERAARRR